VAGRSSTSRRTPGPAGPRCATSGSSGSVGGPTAPSWSSPFGPGPSGRRSPRSCPGIGFRPDGSLTLAPNRMTELALMAEAAAPDPTPPARRTSSSTPPASGTSTRPIKGRRHRRAVVPARRHGRARLGPRCHPSTLEATGRYQWLPGHQAVDVLPSDGGAGPADRSTTVGGTHHGTRVVLCVGDRLSGFSGRVGAALAAAPLRRCRLQMMQTAPTSEHLTTPIADGDSMRYYPAFDLPALDACCRPPPRPPSGACSCWWCNGPAGADHRRHPPLRRALRLRRRRGPLRPPHARAEALLGWDPATGGPPVGRGVHGLVTDDSHLLPPADRPRVWVVTGPAGRGMTLSPGHRRADVG
jgi:hypothetical protein